MVEGDFLEPPAPIPALDVPHGTGTVNVRIIDTTTKLSGASSIFFKQVLKGFDSITVPSFSFLVTNGNRHLLFDLGTRKDWENLSPAVVKIIKGFSALTVEKNVADILDEHAEHTGIHSRDIDTVVWSHHHFDHTGDITTFPASTDLIVGPGFPEEYGPGYPKDPKSSLLVADFEGRTVRELDFQKESKGKMLGSFPAIDFFGDGSFFLLDSPGHTCGHISGLARVSTSPDSFVFMGGDIAHHPGLLKPTQWHPLPKTINPSPVSLFAGGCPGEILRQIHLKNTATEPFLEPSRDLPFSPDVNERSISYTQEVDALENVLIILAHDAALAEYLDFFPNNINDWYAKDLDNKTRWAFIRDLEPVVEKTHASASKI